MSRVPEPIARFLSGKRLAVAGVSRNSAQPANAIFRKLRNSGYDVVAINPNAGEVEGVRSYADLSLVSGSIDGLMIVTHPDVSVDLVRQCADRGVGRVWLHRSFGGGSVSDAAVRLCGARGIECIVGGCPLMYCEPVDFGHRCMRWILRMKGRLP